MLLVEQYLIIYLLAVLLLEDKDIKVMCGYLGLYFIVDNFVYSYLKISPQEYLITISFLEILALLLITQYIKSKKTKFLFIFCYTPTLIVSLFILSIDHWISRDDLLSYVLFVFCMHVGRYSNEILLTYIVYSTRSKNLKTNFWNIFVCFNYIAILLGSMET